MPVSNQLKYARLRRTFKTALQLIDREPAHSPRWLLAHLVYDAVRRYEIRPGRRTRRPPQRKI